MLKIKSYVKAESLQQAYELNQKKTAVIRGGMVCHYWGKHLGKIWLFRCSYPVPGYGYLGGIV